MTIWILLLAVVLGLIAGVVRQGDFRTILGTRVYHPEFLASSIICALVVSWTKTDSDGLIAFVALLGAFAFTLMNLHLVGMVVVSIGLALNLFVFILNFETPVRPNALVEAERVTAEELERGISISGHVELADSDTVLEVLGDTFPIRLGEKVVSIGDLILLVGLANVTGNLMLGNQRRRYAYGQFLPGDEVQEGDPEYEQAEIPIELEFETPEPASVYAESTAAYEDQAGYPEGSGYLESEPYPETETGYPDPAGYPEPETSYAESATVYPETETSYPEPETGYAESATVYPESYEEHSESATVYPQPDPDAPQTQHPEDPPKEEDRQEPKDRWSEPPWNPSP